MDIEKLKNKRQKNVREQNAITKHFMLQGAKYWKDNMMGVWFNAKITPWKSHLECAREAYQYFKLPILCDPGQDSFGPGEFILIDKNGESIINIDEE